MIETDNDSLLQSRTTKRVTRLVVFGKGTFVLFAFLFTKTVLL